MDCHALLQAEIISQNFESQRRDLLISSSRTTESLSTKLGTKYSCIKVKFVHMKGIALFQGEIIKKWQKCIDKILKSSSLEQLANFNQTWHKATSGEGDSSLFKLRATALISGK